METFQIAEKYIYISNNVAKIQFIIQSNKLSTT